MARSTALTKVPAFTLLLLTSLAMGCASPAEEETGEGDDALSKKSPASDSSTPTSPRAPRDDWEVAREWAREASNVDDARYTGEPTICRGYRSGDGALGTGLFASVQFVGSGPSQLDALTSAFVQCKRMVFNQAPNHEYNQRALCFTRHYVQCRNDR